MCYGDGVQYTTGCTFGKGNIRKEPRGKLAFTLIDKDSNRAVRVSYKPTLQKQIAASAFMQQRAAGYQPDEIPEADQMELVDLVWNAPEDGHRDGRRGLRLRPATGCRRSWASPSASRAASWWRTRTSEWWVTARCASRVRDTIGNAARPLRSRRFQRSSTEHGRSHEPHYLYHQRRTGLRLLRPAGHGRAGRGVPVRAAVLLPGRAAGRGHADRPAAERGQPAVRDDQLLARQADQLPGRAAGADRRRDPVAVRRAADAARGHEAAAGAVRRLPGLCRGS